MVVGVGSMLSEPLIHDRRTQQQPLPLPLPPPPPPQPAARDFSSGHMQSGQQQQQQQQHANGDAADLIRQPKEEEQEVSESQAEQMRNWKKRGRKLVFFSFSSFLAVFGDDDDEVAVTTKQEEVSKAVCERVLWRVISKGEREREWNRSKFLQSASRGGRRRVSACVRALYSFTLVAWLASLLHIATVHTVRSTCITTVLQYDGRKRGGGELSLSSFVVVKVKTHTRIMMMVCYGSMLVCTPRATFLPA